MRTFKYVVFWLLLLALITALFWRTPLNNVGSPVFILIPLGVIAWLATRFGRKKSDFKLPPNLSQGKPFGSGSKETDLDAHSHLVRLCFGDAGKVERLIAYHMKKRPGINRGQATRDAIEGILRDRRQ